MAIPTNKERLENAETRLDRIETALGLQPPKPKSPTRQFLKHLSGRIKANKGTILTICGLTLGVVGWFVGSNYKYYLDHKDDGLNSAVDRRIDAMLGKPGGIGQKLDNLQTTVTEVSASLKTLIPFVDDVVQHQFESASKLPVSTLQERLPAVEHLLAVARDQQVKVDPRAVERLSAKLRDTKITAGGFWPAVGGLISYRSLLVGHDVARLTQSKLPTCTDRDPGGMEVDSVRTQPSPADKDHTQATIEVENARYADCTLTLDSPEQANKINWILQHRMNRISFTHCLIVYRGGPINITMELNNEPRILRYYDPSGQLRGSSGVTVSGPTLQFTNCLFDFALLTAPTEPGQSFARSVLTQNGLSIVLHSLTTHS